MIIHRCTSVHQEAWPFGHSHTHLVQDEGPDCSLEEIQQALDYLMLVRSSQGLTPEEKRQCAQLMAVERALLGLPPIVE